MMKSITLIAKGKTTCQALLHQLHELLGDRVKLHGYYVDGTLKTTVTGDLVVFSSQIVYEQTKEYLPLNCPVIIARRSINYHDIDKLLDIPAGTGVLLVNDLKSSTLETISLLQALGLHHLDYFPFYPGVEDFPRVKVAVTPGELDLVPDFVEKVIDIKTRNIDMTTLVEILRFLELLDEKANLLSARYIKDILNLIKKAKQMADTNNQMKHQLQTIINTVHDGIIALDQQDKISVFNARAEEIFGLNGAELLGKSLQDEALDKEVFSILRGEKVEGENFVKIKERQVVINNSLIKENDSPMGRVYTLKDVTEIQRLEEELRRKLLGREYYARYTFADIVGKSEPLVYTKELAAKIARSHSPILIQGENGTGKELFAQAIHNASPRKKGPFIAVNFAALPESLLESELFGYNEGAFTGAKKGGMPGLFEQAHGGTIFLDEIGDAPLSFQIRLLRVLEEKEVRRIGGSRVIPVDVRVIAATNKDLKGLIEKGLFRQDLYYRLNVLPLKLPSLRERKEDIMTLVEIFYKRFFKGRPSLKAEEYFKAVRDPFLAYSWPGNIRQLHNVVEYLVNICPDHAPEPQLLPEEIKDFAPEESLNTEKDVFIRNLFTEIAEANKRGEPIGRRSLAEKVGISEGQARQLIEKLRKKGLLKVRRGVKGLELSMEGHRWLGALS
jgi:PAS domain S-box-containing protein